MRCSAIRFRNLLTTVLAVVILFLTAASGVVAEAPRTLEGTFTSRAGAQMGRVILTPIAGGGFRVDLTVRGFDPVAGRHRFVVTDVGHCCPPDLACAGGTLAVLPDVQFASDGSATYRETTVAVAYGALADPDGSAVLLFADGRAESEVIGCGVLVPGKAVPAVPAPTPEPPAGFGPAARVWAAFGLRLRQEPGLGRTVLTVLSHGSAVFPSAETAIRDGIAWVRVCAVRGERAHIGWVAADYVVWPDSPPPPPAGEIILRVVAPAGLRLRAGPGLGHGIQRIMPYGALLRSTGEERAAGTEIWAEIKIDGARLWAARRWLQRQ